MRPLAVESDLQIHAFAVYLMQIANLSKIPFYSSIKYSTYYFSLLYFWSLYIPNLGSWHMLFFYLPWYYIIFSHGCLPYCFGLILKFLSSERSSLTIIAKADHLLPLIFFTAIQLSTWIMFDYFMLIGCSSAWEYELLESKDSVLFTAVLPVPQTVTHTW